MPIQPSRFLQLLVVLALPVATFFGGGALLLHLSGRGAFPQGAEPASVPLHFRLSGYDGAEAQAYWDWLGPEGRLAEVRFLKLDLLFPLAYGAALLAASWLLWTWLGRPVPRRLLPLPVTFTLLADWTENLIQWQQLRRVMGHEPLQSSWIRLAGLATTVKMLCFTLAAVLLLVLAARWAVGGRLPPPSDP